MPPRSIVRIILTSVVLLGAISKCDNTGPTPNSSFHTIALSTADCAARLLPPETAVKITVVDSLIDPVWVYANDSLLGAADADTTSCGYIGSVDSLQVTWILMRPSNAYGDAFGEPMRDTFSTIRNPHDSVKFYINNIIGTQPYFTPEIKNAGANRIEIVVNFGLFVGDSLVENFCNCTVPSDSEYYYNIGYYRLYTNSKVFGFPVDSSYYAANYVYWSYPFGGIASGSGVVKLTNSFTLTSPPAHWGGVGVPGAPTPARVPASTRLRQSRAEIARPVYRTRGPK